MFEPKKRIVVDRECLDNATVHPARCFVALALQKAGYERAEVDNSPCDSGYWASCQNGHGAQVRAFIPQDIVPLIAAFDDNNTLPEPFEFDIAFEEY